ncbi:DUF1799 domain-containing protein [Rhizobium sp. CC-YZS058]|uniref:DUF1799 domain-containing protein n=1 Tax=Rhizobium sp. CC-YZS058 TaxID=3042153 RepID=UPI002B058525|nr:DUF1799 domain-containing protein [Rhizobium sp. CC-YZS058]MEA3533728.1 DUF1799 domain-containing protein [Rhizobium sp. CC-YZS058]
MSVHNADSLSAFMACSTQWRTQGTQAGLVWIGLDYTACKAMLEAQDLPISSLADFPLIEEAVLPIFNRQDDGGSEG